LKELVLAYEVSRERLRVRADASAASSSAALEALPETQGISADDGARPKSSTASSSAPVANAIQGPAAPSPAGNSALRPPSPYQGNAGAAAPTASSQPSLAPVSGGLQIPPDESTPSLVVTFARADHGDEIQELLAFFAVAGTSEADQDKLLRQGAVCLDDLRWATEPTPAFLVDVVGLKEGTAVRLKRRLGEFKFTPEARAARRALLSQGQPVVWRPDPSSMPFFDAAWDNPEAQALVRFLTWQQPGSLKIAPELAELLFKADCLEVIDVTDITDEKLSKSFGIPQMVVARLRKMVPKVPN